MNTQYHQTEIIERHLNNELTTDEQHWFEKELKSNSNFAKEVLLHKDINKATIDMTIMSSINVKPKLFRFCLFISFQVYTQATSICEFQEVRANHVQGASFY